MSGFAFLGKRKYAYHLFVVNFSFCEKNTDIISIGKFYIEIYQELVSPCIVRDLYSYVICYIIAVQSNVLLYIFYAIMHVNEKKFIKKTIC